MTTFAYCRVSKLSQTTDNQGKEIEDAGYTVDSWHFEDGVTGSMKAFDRTAFKAMMLLAKEGDTIITVKIDRLGRNAADIMATIDEIVQRKIKLRIMQFDGVDMGSTIGKLLKSVMAAVAELEKDMLIERINAGIARSQAEGTLFGTPLKISPKMMRDICHEVDEGCTLSYLAKKYKISKSTLALNVVKWGSNLRGYEEEYIAREQQYAAKAARKASNAKQLR